MRALLLTLLLAILPALSGCDVFGGGETLRISYEVRATGNRGPVTLTYDGPDGPVRIEDARIPFREEIQINSPRFGSVFLLNAEADFAGQGSLTTEVDAAIDGTPYTAQDRAVSPDDTPRTLVSAASIVVR
jgi:hypothetical protein